MYIGFACDLSHIWQKAYKSSKSAVQWWWHFASSSHGPKPLYRQKALQEFFAPSDVQANLQCAMLISSAAYTHTHTVWPRFQSSCLCEGSCPIVPVMENFMPFEGPVGVWWRCYNWPTMFPKKDVKCTKLFLVQGTVTASKTDHCWHASIEIFQPRIYWSCFVLQYPAVCTHTHNSRPSQNYGPRGTWENYYNQTSAFQAPLYKSLLMRAPCLRFGRLKPRWMENFLCKRFNLIIPASRWATNPSARFYTIIHFPPLVGIPFTRNRGPGIHCRWNLRCKTKSSNQQSLSPWSIIKYLLCIFQFFVHFLHQCMPIIVHQGCPSNNWTKHTVSHHF